MFFFRFKAILFAFAFETLGKCAINNLLNLSVEVLTSNVECVFRILSNLARIY